MSGSANSYPISPGYARPGAERRRQRSLQDARYRSVTARLPPDETVPLDIDPRERNHMHSLLHVELARTLASEKAESALTRGAHSSRVVPRVASRARVGRGSRGTVRRVVAQDPATARRSASQKGAVESTQADQARGVGGRMAADEISRLVRSAATGDSRAWERLVVEFSGLLRAIARAHRLNDADSEDVSQATWLNLLEHLDELNDPACVGGWLATTARRECLRILRRADRQLPCGDDMPEPRSTAASPDSELLVSERDAALWCGFDRLRTSDQALLRLLVADPCPAYEEISATLDMPVGSIGPTRARAFERLRAALDSAGSLRLLVA
jgi:RNA polymerase sigma factor (sigma-70 family)